jgi:hypothetical protein
VTHTGPTFVFVADTLNSTIRVMQPGGVVSTYAGTAGTAGHHDANGTSATFSDPQGVAVDSSGNVFVADTFNDTIRKIATNGDVTTYAGAASLAGNTDAVSLASNARFTNPAAVAVDSSGNVYVADTGNNSIRKIAVGTTVGGAVTTIAGSSAGFDSPKGVAVDSLGNVYVADTFNSVIRMIAPGGTVSILAGDLGNPGTVDGTGPAAQFSLPIGITVDGAGNVFVGDSVSNTIRKVTQAGVVTTIGGLAGSSAASTNGTDSYARFNSPQGIAVGSTGVLYLADSANNLIREGVIQSTSGDLTGTGMPDIFWTDTTTGGRGVYIMNGTAPQSWTDLGSPSTDWRIAAVADFTGNGNNDILWQNTSTGLCGYWIMNGPTVTGWVQLGTLPTQWRIGGVGDFSGTGSQDILWQNTSTGLCGFYIMNGTTIVSWVELGTLPTQWKIAAVADFNHEGKPDILWQNTSTGECGFYIMNGTSIGSWAELGTLPTDWRIAAVGDFNGDGNPDILWQNSVTGVAGFYIMNGTSINSWVGLGQFPLEWQIQP